jgi:hypothetical protein
MNNRFTASEDKHGDWLIFDNEDFYCCYGPTTEPDATSEMRKLNRQNNEKNKKVSILTKRIVELEETINDIVEAVLDNRSKQVTGKTLNVIRAAIDKFGLRRNYKGGAE